MKFIILILAGIFSLASFACIEEHWVYGSELKQLSQKQNIYIDQGQARFQSAQQFDINPEQFYYIQKGPRVYNERYNRKYLTYYTYKRMTDYLTGINSNLALIGYQNLVIGHSLEGRNLYSIFPKNMDPSKKTIVILARQHGDEGSANWIVEGLISELLKIEEEFHNNFQVIIYPMVNPDGVVMHSRYNANDRDLNRSWFLDPAKSYDEIKVVNTHLQNSDLDLSQILLLDMHGSYEKDFVFRVKRSYISREYYEMQQSFIDSMALFDEWQNGKYKHSNGSSRMARIVFGKHFNSNALTHETPRDIKIRNSKNRTIASLKQQGRAIVKAILKLY